MSNIIYEPLWGSFTGQLTVQYTKDGHRCQFQRPYPRIQKDQAYMLKVDLTKGVAQLLVVVPPEYEVAGSTGA